MKRWIPLLLIAAVVLVAVPFKLQSSTAQTPVVRAAFFYPWFPNGWAQQGLDPFSHYTPSAGYYSSNDPAIIKQQIAAMQYAHLNAGIASWWGQGSQEDTVIPSLLAGANGTGFKWSLYYEPEGIGTPSVSQIESDLSYIKTRYASSPNYLTIDGKPTIFVYFGPKDGCGTASRWWHANQHEGFYTVLKVFPGYESCKWQPSQWHQYGPSVAEDHQVGHSFTISPGYWKANEAAPLLTRNLARWTQNVQDMVNSNEPLQLIETWNEWGEGSAVESSTAWPSASGYGQYVDVLHNVLGGTTTTTTTVPPTTTTVPVTTTTTNPTTSTTTVPPTTTTTQPATGHKVLVIMEENHTASEFYAGLPYLNTLATTYGRATDYDAITHPSLPNYLAIFGGSTFGTSSDCAVGCGPTSANTSVFDQTIAAGGTARAYAESMPSNCDTSNSGNYVTKHNEWVYFSNPTSRANCDADDVPLTELQADISAGTLPTTGQITPNIQDDWHTGTAAEANTFLETWIPALMAGPDYTSGKLSIVVVADEDDNSSPNGVPFVVINKALSAKVVNGAFNHYSLTRWLDDNAGVPPLLNASGASDIGAAFGL
jgi:hypothetical protein